MDDMTIRALTDAALANPSIFRVQATCDTENVPSQRALEKAGFMREGRFERHTAQPFGHSLVSNHMQPVISSERLVLRPFRPSDAQAVQHLAGDYRVAEPTANLPHPYPDGAAEEWIAAHPSAFATRSSVVYAICLAKDEELVGAISLSLMSDVHHRAELGYWIGFPYWSRGICSEAAKVLISYGRSEFQLTRIVCRCLSRNIGSARVMEKAGFVREGHLIKDINHRGKYEDLFLYGLVLPGREDEA